MQAGDTNIKLGRELAREVDIRVVLFIALLLFFALGVLLIGAIKKGSRAIKRPSSKSPVKIGVAITLLSVLKDPASYAALSRSLIEKLSSMSLYTAEGSETSRGNLDFLASNTSRQLFPWDFSVEQPLPYQMFLGKDKNVR